MKKILAASAFALAALTGCPSPSDQLCIKNYECQGEDDPAGKCSEDLADADEDALACRDTCKSQSDAYATCALESGECTDIGGTDYFISEDCPDEAEAVADCAADC